MITQHCLHPWPSNLTWILGWPVDDPYWFWGHRVKSQGHWPWIRNIFRVITRHCLHPCPSNLTLRLGVTSRWPLLILRSSGERSRSQWPRLSVWLLNNARSYGPQTGHGGTASLVNDPYWIWGHRVKDQGHWHWTWNLVRVITRHCLHPWPSNWPVDDP